MISFVVPATPPSSLSQNSRLDWRPRQTIKHAWKEAAANAAIHATSGTGETLDPTKRYWVHVEVSWEKGHRIVDDDNLVASFKHARDAIAEVFGIDDKMFRTGEVIQSRDKEGRGYTTVWIEERVGAWRFVPGG